MTSPFETAHARYTILVNLVGQHSLWPDSLDVPTGWTVVYGPACRADCFHHVNEHWTDLRPSTA